MSPKLFNAALQKSMRPMVERWLAKGLGFDMGEGLPDGTRRVLALRRLYDHIHPPGCSCKVLESKGKVVLALAKPPRSTTFDAVKDWRTLTLACGAERIDVADPFSSHQQKSFDGMMAGLPPLPAKSAARPH